jgi:glycosyltransferase involved in cell wall biosynthesis
MQEEIPRLSVAILAHDEARDLAALLETIAFADEVVVADAESSDDTADAARRAGAEVIPVKNDYNLNVNKTAAIDACRGEWILYLDPDERVTPELADALRAAAADGDAPYDAYEFPRLNNYFGRYLKHARAPRRRRPRRQARGAALPRDVPHVGRLPPEAAVVRGRRSRLPGTARPAFLVHR